MFSSTYKNKEELILFWLKHLDIPNRTSGRTTEDVEMMIMAKYLLASIKAPFWQYPVRIIHQDRPDFVIESNSGRIGIEVTEQWSLSYGHALALLENSNGLLEPSDFSLNGGDKKRTGKKLGTLVRKEKLTGEASMGDWEERNWITRTAKTSINKSIKAKKYPTVKNFTALHLCIFDVRPEFPDFKDLTNEHLQPLYDSEIASIFSIVVCIDRQMVHIDLEKRTFHAELNLNRRISNLRSYAET